MIPNQVWKEVVDQGAGRPPADWVAEHLQTSRREADAKLSAAYAAQVDAGEADALALAACIEGACLLMDDARGRAVAKANGFRCIGTLGLLVEARRRGWIEHLKPELAALREAGWHISEPLHADALKACGEDGG